MWPLGESSHRNNPVKTKVAWERKKKERKKGVNFSPYQFPDLLHHVTARALVPAQSTA